MKPVDPNGRSLRGASAENRRRGRWKESVDDGKNPPDAPPVGSSLRGLLFDAEQCACLGGQLGSDLGDRPSGGLRHARNVVELGTYAAPVT